ncbi:DCP2-domain-containing protein [Rozella allomycis CSF55]|uniref:DCP2-domain-containing protein n=1 Tax=Rozella allomycis (strain CSF55) TaxID=988480 RepID=A0A4P9YCX5_ROZAC|nr:DCP2-domain-containing protein [Rozella allomycis CSF55]
MAEGEDPLEYVFDDLSARFILNIPEEDLASFERLGFQIEQAHWFYDDFYRENNPQLPKMNLKSFAEYLFKHCPSLNQHLNIVDEVINMFRNYKGKVPVCGAVILNKEKDKVLLVKGYSGSTWSFPRGKINQNENEMSCAIREVLEETGFDISEFVNEQDYIELFLEKRARMYVAVGIPENSTFATRTRKEISKIAWHNIADISKKPERYYNVKPFLKKMKKFLKGGLYKDLLKSPDLKSKASSYNSEPEIKKSSKKYESSSGYKSEHSNVKKVQTQKVQILTKEIHKKMIEDEELKEQGIDLVNTM